MNSQIWKEREGEGEREREGIDDAMDQSIWWESTKLKIRKVAIKKLILIFPPSFFFSSTSSQSLLHQFLFQFVLLKVLHCLRPFSHFCFVFVILIIFFLNFVIFFLVSFVLSFSFFADLPAKGRTPPSSSSSSPSQPVTQSPTVPAME